MYPVDAGDGPAEPGEEDEGNEGTKCSYDLDEQRMSRDTGHADEKKGTGCVQNIVAPCVVMHVLKAAHDKWSFVGIKETIRLGL